MPPHLLINFEIQKFHQNESRFNGVYSRNNLPKITNGTYVINLDEYKSHDGIYFDSLGVTAIWGFQ